MTTFLRNRFWFIAFLLCSARLCSAQAPSGTVRFDFDRFTAPLIDLSGSFGATNQAIIGAGGEPTTLSFGADITHDAKGKLHGQGTAIVFVGNDPLAAEYVANGHVSGGGNNPIRVKLSIRMTGSGTLGGRPISSFRINVSYNLTYIVEDGFLEGRSSGSASFTGFGTSSLKGNVAVPLPGSDGSWSAILNIVPLNKIGGSGTIVIYPSGRTLSGNLNGSFKASQNLSKIHLKGVKPDNGFNVTFNVGANEDGGAELETMNGKILGQKVLQ